MSGLPSSPSAAVKVRNPHLWGAAGACVVQTSALPADAEPNEATLQDKIEARCRQEGWWYNRSRMDMPTTCRVGAPDFTIALAGRVLFIECKSRTGKMTPAQLGNAMLLERNGHKLHVVRSMQEFEALI